jgi:aryl-alcohol dehydrogenase-like predicted oxidoreductase
MKYSRSVIESLPRIWLSLSAPDEPDAGADWRERLVSTALESGLPIDVGSQPGFWGGALRGTEARLMTIGGADVARAVDAEHAGHLIEAHLIETLSAVGRQNLDVYFLHIRAPLQEFQIAGALEALQSARQEGVLGVVGVCADPRLADAQAISALLSRNRSFEALLLPRNHYAQDVYRTLRPAGKKAHVASFRPLNWGYGLPFPMLPSVWRLRNLTQSFYGLTIAQAALADLARDHPVLVGVRTPEEVRLAAEALAHELPEGLDAMLEPFRQAFDGEDDWHELLEHPRPLARAAAKRRLHDLQRV